VNAQASIVQHCGERGPLPARPCNNAAAGHFTAKNTGDLPRLVAKLSWNFRRRRILHRQTCRYRDLLWRAINRLPSLFPPRMTCHANFSVPACDPLRRAGDFC
jgi:hypothetical protein